MIIIPAIDLKDGKCVRLVQGDFKRVTIYADDPLEMARLWQAKGAVRIHIVDLDGSLAGQPKNKEVIKRIVNELKVPLQLGGGIRDMETIGRYIDMGVRWIILGTAALRNKNLIRTACETYSGHVILAVDALDGMVAISGWTEKTSQSAVEMVKFYEGYGLDAFIYTDIKRDGMETGINIEKTRELAETVSIPIIASGGVSSLQDIEKLLAIEGRGVMGVIIGKALYTGAISLTDAIAYSLKNGGK